MTIQPIATKLHIETPADIYEKAVAEHRAKDNVQFNILIKSDERDTIAMLARKLGWSQRKTVITAINMLEAHMALGHVVKVEGDQP